MKGRVWLRPCWVCLCAGFWGIITQTITTIRPLTPLRSCLFFHFSAGSSSKQTLLAVMHLSVKCLFVPFAQAVTCCRSRASQDDDSGRLVSCLMLQKGETGSQKGLNRTQMCHTYICIAAAALKLCHFIALHQPLGPVKPVPDSCNLSLHRVV